MNDASQEVEPRWTPPYIAWRTILNLIERLETDMPPQIDRTFLKGSNQSNAQTMNALKSLDLIGEGGAVTPELVRLVQAGIGRPAAVRQLLEALYSEPARLGTVNATQQQLDKAFEEYGVSGSTLRKAVSFYLKAAAYAQMPLSPHFKTPSNDSGMPRKRRPRASKATVGVASENGVVAHPAPDAMEQERLDYVKMLKDKARKQEKMDEGLLNRIEKLLRFPGAGTEKEGA